MKGKKTKIVFLILPRIHLLDLSGPDQVFLEAREMGLPIDIVYCSPKSAITSSSGITMSSLISFLDVSVSKGDYIIIPGTDLQYLLNYEVPKKDQIYGWLRTAHQNEVKICSICTGAFFLAFTGLLDEKKCTTHWKRTRELKEMFPSLKVQEDILYTEDDGLFTSAGVTAGIDLSLHIISQLLDEQLAFAVARELVVYIRRKRDDSQKSIFISFRNHIHSGVHSVQDHIQHSMSGDLSLQSLAKVANMSERNLTRVFKKETGITINEYVTLVRKEYLNQLKNDPDLTRKQMASLCGLRSERHLIRLLKAPTGTSYSH